MSGKTRRRDTVLKWIASSVRHNNRNNQVYIKQSPPNIVANGLRPDIVVTDDTKREVTILDLVITSQSHQNHWNMPGIVKEKSTRQLLFNINYVVTMFQMMLSPMVEDGSLVFFEP